MQYRDRRPTNGVALALARSAAYASQVPPLTAPDGHSRTWASVIRPQARHLAAAFHAGRHRRDELAAQGLRTALADAIWAKPSPPKPAPAPLRTHPDIIATPAPLPPRNRVDGRFMPAQDVRTPAQNQRIAPRGPYAR